MKSINQNRKPVNFRLYFLKAQRFVLCVAVLSTLLLASCSEDETPKRVVLTEATPFLQRTAHELKQYVENFPVALDIDATAIKHDVDIFKVKYKTMFKGSEVIASGIVILPKTDDKVGMVSFQHGTIVSQSAAPTALPLSSNELILYSALASTGFITVIPDFIGFGESKIYFHPYYVEEATASAIIDNMKAAKEWAGESGVNFNGRLFLAGYSQGGYATMATHKTIETTGLPGFELIASFPASGGYDVKGMQEYFFDQQNYDQPYYIAYVALSYKSYYGWNENLIGQFFKEPYATRIPSLFNGTNGGGQINSQLTNNIPNLLNDNLRANIDTDAQYKFLVDAFNENSLLDWKPRTKMFMYHGDADVTVPYQNSIDTYEYFMSQGVSDNIVSFRTLDGATHETGVFPYIEDFINLVLVLK